LRRIGIIAFANQSGTPDAGVRVANFFFNELNPYHRFELTPPLLLDEQAELAFTRTAQAGPEEARPDRLRQFVLEWIGRLWPSTAQPSEMSQGQTPARPGSTHQRSLPLDAVLTGVILRYEDRDGHALSVDRPASVAYEAYLISARDGAMLWRARFDETQKPLLDNLLLGHETSLVGDMPRSPRGRQPAARRSQQLSRWPRTTSKRIGGRWWYLHAMWV
jgi:hypothetical protein